MNLPSSSSAPGAAPTTPASASGSAPGSEAPPSLPAIPERPLSEGEKLSRVGDLLGEADAGNRNPAKEQQPDVEPENKAEGPGPAAEDDPGQPKTDAPVGSDPGTDADADGDPGEPDVELTQLDADSLAEALGIDKKDLYNLEIPMGDGENLTLGALKDAVLTSKRESAEHEVQAQRRETERTELLVARNEVAGLVGKLAPYLPDNVLADFRATAEVEAAQERELVLRAFPEWQDPHTYQTARADMVTLVGRFGFTPTELAGLADHRIVNMLVSFTELEKRMQKITDRKPDAAQVPKGQARGKRVSGKETDQAAIRNARGGSQRDKLSAVGKLLKGK